MINPTSIAICAKWIEIIGLGFHPYIPGDQYVKGGGVWDQDEKPDWLFTPEQVKEYEADMASLFSLHGDPHQASIIALENWEAKNMTKEQPEQGETIADLIEVYSAWNKEHGLTLGSADDHWFDESLTETQRRWLRDFSRRWDRRTREEDSSR